MERHSLQAALSSRHSATLPFPPFSSPYRKHLTAFSVLGMLMIGACGDAPDAPVSPVPLPGGPVSRLDGKPLDQAALERLRAVGEGCTFAVLDFQGLVRRVGLPRGKVPFHLPAIRRNPATGLGDGKLISAGIEWGGTGTIQVVCLAPSDLSPISFGTSLVDSRGSQGWGVVLKALAARRGVPKDELRARPSLEAREFLYELAPSIFASTGHGGAVDVDVDAGIANLTSAIQCTLNMSLRASLGMANSSGDSCVCTAHYYDMAWNDEPMQTYFHYWDCEVYWEPDGGDAPTYDYSELDSFDPYGYTEEMGGSLPPPPCSSSPPPDDDPPPDDGDVQVDSLGREYIRSMSVCVDTTTAPPPAEPEPYWVPLCPSSKLCNLALEKQDSAIITKALAAPMRDGAAFTDTTAKRVCGELRKRLGELWAIEGMFARGNPSIPDDSTDVTKNRHDAVYNALYKIHIDSDFLRDSTVTPSRMLAIILHEVAHEQRYPNHDKPGEPDSTGAYLTFPYNHTTYATPNSCTAP